jgi:hypothetical protein
MFDLNRHLKSKKVSIFGCAETFSNSDEKPYNLDNDYTYEATRFWNRCCLAQIIKVIIEIMIVTYKWML